MLKNEQWQDSDRTVKCILEQGMCTEDRRSDTYFALTKRFQFDNLVCSF